MLYKVKIRKVTWVVSKYYIFSDAEHPFSCIFGQVLVGFSPSTLCRTEQTLTVERSSLLWSFDPFSNLLRGKTLFQKEVFTRTCCCTVGQKQGHAGGVIGGTQWEMVPLFW